MAKWANDLVMDAALDKVATANQLIVCTAQPTDRANALSTALASTALTGGSFTKADGNTNGRKVTIAQQNGISATGTGTATHIALVDATSLIYVTTCIAQAVTSGNAINVPAWKIEISDPS